MITRFSGLARFVVVGAFVLTLAGCFGDQIWTADVSAPARAGTSRLVFGIDASKGGLDVALEREDNPEHGCAPLIKAQSPDGATGITYFAFDVRPGKYAASIFETSASLLRDDPALFIVPAGRSVYIGTFVLTATRDINTHSSVLHDYMHLDRSLPAAQAGASSPAIGLELAEAVPGTHPGSDAGCLIF